VKKLIIASRGSQLALWQSEHIKARLEEQNPGMEVEIKIYKTTGDKILDVPLAKIGGKGLFTKELEEAMARGDAHIAVHSLKDVPTRFEPGFVLGAVTKREDVRDAMLSEKYASIDALPKGAVVGTTSLRRRMQILKARPDLVVKDLRGNVQTRIQKLKDGVYDAIILAMAGMNRLGLRGEVKHLVPIEKDVMIPAMGQAALGIECIDDAEVTAIVSGLNDDAALVETTIEREFIDALDGGCQVPIGVSAKLYNDGKIDLEAIVGMPDGSEMIHERIVTTQDEYKTIGRAFAETFVERGARELLKRAEAVAFK
jgi:hydroxymethylbilane synthase